MRHHPTEVVHARVDVLQNHSRPTVLLVASVNHPVNLVHQAATSFRRLRQVRRGVYARLDLHAQGVQGEGEVHREASQHVGHVAELSLLKVVEHAFFFLFRALALNRESHSNSPPHTQHARARALQMGIDVVVEEKSSAGGKNAFARAESTTTERAREGAVVRLLLNEETPILVTI